MNQITELHREAMSARDEALAAKRAGHDQDALVHFRKAYRFETLAADGLAADFSAEPSRSVLFRSAATIAKECGYFEDAEHLIYRALAGNPPPTLKTELKDLLEDVTFSRHLELRGITLAADELQMAIAGNDISFGMAPADVFMSRVQATDNLLVRTAERTQNRPYRDHGRRDRLIGQFFISTPRAASLAVTFRLGSAQSPLPEVSFGQAVIDEFIACLELFSIAPEAVREKITDEAYYRNFVALAKNLEPDGSKVSVVGYTTFREGRSKQVALRRRGGDAGLAGYDTTLVTPAKFREQTGDRPDTIIGELQFASIIKKARRTVSEIKIVPKHGRPVTVVVPSGLMDDIVKPLWASEVVASGQFKRDKFYMTDIRAAPSES